MASSAEFQKETQKGSGHGPSVQLPNSAPAISNQNLSAPSMRPRSLYTAHSYHAQPDEANFQVNKNSNFIVVLKKFLIF